MNKQYNVNFWASHPENDNDDCWNVEEFETKEDALACFKRDADRDIEYIELDGPDSYELRNNPAFSPTTTRNDDDDDWKQEAAMQAGMAFGCAGYNDAMGYNMDAPYDEDIM